MSDYNKIIDIKLKNGLRVIIDPLHRAPVASLQFIIKSGSMHEVDPGYGLSHFLEHMIFKGCRGFETAELVAKEIQNCSSVMNAYTSKDHTLYYIDTPAHSVDKMLTVLVNSVVHPIFPPEEFVSEKEVVLREEAMYKDNVNSVIGEKSIELISDSHPFGAPVIGFPEKISLVDRQLVMDYHKDNYQPRNAFVVISGAVDPVAIIAQLEELTADWAIAPIVKNIYGDLKPLPCQLDKTIYFKDPHARLQLSFALPDLSELETVAMDILEIILGNSKNSLLTKRLKKDDELVYSIATSSIILRKAGMFTILATTDSENLSAVEEAIIEEITNLQADGINIAQLKSAILQERIELLEMKLGVGERCQAIVSTVNSINTTNLFDLYEKYLNEIDCQSIKDIAKKYLNIATMAKVVQLPASEDDSVIADYACDELVDIHEFEPLAGKIKNAWVEVPELPFIQGSLLIPYGSFADELGKSGIATLVSKMLLCGSENLTEEQLLQNLDDHGISLRVSAGANSIIINFTTLPEYSDVLLNILNEILLHPNIEERCFNREKRQLLAAIESNSQRLFYPARQALCETLYPEKHPYRNSVIGTIESVETIEIADLYHYIGNMFVDKKVILAVASDSRDKYDTIAQFFAENSDKFLWQKDAMREFPPPNVIPNAITKKVELPRNETLVLLGLKGVSSFNVKNHVIDVISAAFNSQNNILMQEVRENRGLAYDLGVVVREGIEPGYILMYALCGAKNATMIVELFNEIADTVAEKGISKQEFDEVIQQISTDIAFTTQHADQIAAKTVLNMFYDLPARTFLDEVENMRNYCYDEVNAEIKRLFSQPGRIAIITGNLGDKNE